MNEKWRVGTKVPLNIYRDDVPICQCHSDIDSRFIVAGMNQVEYLLESERSLREQNAALALELADHVYLLETGKVVTSGPSSMVQNDETLRKAYLGY